MYSSVELFRSSPFFLAIEQAFNDPSKSDLFFKLHLLQVSSCQRDAHEAKGGWRGRSRMLASHAFVALLEST